MNSKNEANKQEALLLTALGFVCFLYLWWHLAAWQLAKELSS